VEIRFALHRTPALASGLLVDHAGAEVGVSNNVGLAWAVFALSGKVGPGTLAGGYAGASAGAAISMGLAEALSDDGELSGRGNPLTRGAVTGFGTLLGGMGHTLPFLIERLNTALSVAYVVVVIELVSIAYIRYRYMKSPLVRTIVQVIGGGGIVFALGLLLGRLGAGG